MQVATSPEIQDVVETERRVADLRWLGAVAAQRKAEMHLKAALLEGAASTSSLTAGQTCNRMALWNHPSKSNNANDQQGLVIDGADVLQLERLAAAGNAISVERVTFINLRPMIDMAALNRTMGE